MTEYLRDRQHWIFCIGAVAVWLSFGYPGIRSFVNGDAVRGAPVSTIWVVAFALFGAALLGAMAPKRQTAAFWPLLWVQVAATAVMANSISWAGMSMFLTIIAWQAAMATTPGKALAWVAAQTLVVVVALAQALNPDLCWVIAKSLMLQLLLLFTAQTLRREAEASRALAQSNRELRAAQAIIANTARNAERMRISRDLHDAWGHELTALGLQLEIASNVTEPGRSTEHVLQAKGLARALLAKVRNVVGALRDDERVDLHDALEAMAKSVPAPAIHVDIAPEVRVGPEQAHALLRCAQEAVTNSVKHAGAANLWLGVTAEGDGVRLVAHDDGKARKPGKSTGSGLVGMRERIECLGGRLVVRAEQDLGFTIDAWLPARGPQAA